ncbi:hypothetical protein EJB05_06384 [Eragrostis curvula]|uniref:Uncharacterized protein n=1 Tax=Eragrostis curvula TaxID=38414 RepID=A0A5J9WFT5_9POAL|nr:hypothetical protein EJB05_06384 [Eragrostis curvula]
MELSDPSGSFYGQMAVMEPRLLDVTPGSGSGGNGGRSVVYTSSRRRSRMSTSSTGTSLMPQFDAAADGGGSGSSSAGGLDEPRLRNVRLRADPEAPLTPSQVARLLFLGSPMSSPAATDDNVIIMDGVLVGSNGSRISYSNRRRSASFSDPNLVAAGSPASSGGSSCGSNALVTGSPGSSGGGSCGSSTVLLRLQYSAQETGWLGSGDGGRHGSRSQFAQGREVPRGMQAMTPRFLEMQLGSQSSGRSSASSSSNMQGSPNTPHLFPPAMPGPAFATAAPRAVSSYTVTIRPPASYFTPPRVTVTVTRPGPSTPAQPETMPVQQQPPQPQPETTTFAWPPTAEEDASIAQQLYGPSTGARRRLPVFQAICPEEE